MEKIIRVGENSRRFVRMHDDNYGRIILSNEKKANRSDARSRSGEKAQNYLDNREKDDLSTLEKF